MFRDKYILAAIVAIVVLYLLFLPLSRSGYGYAGYYGYHSGPSFWYWGGARYDYPSQSVRRGSLGGPGRTGGISGGK